VTSNNKNTSLLRYKIYYGRKKVFWYRFKRRTKSLFEKFHHFKEIIWKWHFWRWLTVHILMDTPGNTKGGSITVPLTSCLTGLEWAVGQLTIFVYICKTDYSKPVKHEVNWTVILPPLVFPAHTLTGSLTDTTHVFPTLSLLSLSLSLPPSHTHTHIQIQNFLPFKEHMIYQLPKFKCLSRNMCNNWSEQHFLIFFSIAKFKFWTAKEFLGVNSVTRTLMKTLPNFWTRWPKMSK